MGTTQIQNIDILFGTIILFGFPPYWLIYSTGMFNVWQTTLNVSISSFPSSFLSRNKIFAESQEIKKEIKETDNKIYTESREIKDEIIKTKWN